MNLTRSSISRARLAAFVLLGLIIADAHAFAANAPIGSQGNSTSQTVVADPGVPAASPSGPVVSETVKARSLLKVLRDGGPLMIPIGICSFVLLVFVFERAVTLRKGRIIPRPFVERFLEQLREGELTRESALELCDDNQSPVARMFAAGVRKWGRPSVEIEQAILDAGERICTELRKHIRMMNGVSTVTPLLGLLGTVFGMIQAFDSIAAFDPAMGDSKPLVAAGISVALITTAAGLAVAIPALIAYMYFVGRVDQRIVELDELGMEVVNYISAEALAGAAVERKSSGNRPRGGPNRNAA